MMVDPNTIHTAPRLYTSAPTPLMSMPKGVGATEL